MSNSRLKRLPILFAICGPIASGKSTICREILKSDPSLQLSISTTTRAPRPAETDGVEYHFVSKEEFEKRIQQHRFFEHAVFNNNYYGSGVENIESADRAGNDLLLDIEVQGIKQLKQIYENQVVTIFIHPPSLEVLKERLRARAADSPETVIKRLEIAKKETAVLRDPSFSDYFLINDTIEDTVSALGDVLRAERMRLARIPVTRLAQILD